MHACLRVSLEIVVCIFYMFDNNKIKMIIQNIRRTILDENLFKYYPKHSFGLLHPLRKALRCIMTFNS